MSLVSALAGAFLFAASPDPLGMNLDGQTGYWRVPGTSVPRAGELAATWNRQDNETGGTGSRGTQNVLVLFSPIEYLELSGRFGFPDLSANARVAVPLFGNDRLGLRVAAGLQDPWGGANYFNARYLMAGGSAGPLDASLGYAWGSAGDAGHDWVLKYHPDPVLSGWIWGARLRFTPLAWPLSGAVIHDHSGEGDRTGVRLRAGLYDGWSLQTDLARDHRRSRWDVSMGLDGRLSDSVVPSRDPGTGGDALELLVAPWLRTLLGIEMSDFEAQFAVDATLIAKPFPSAVPGAALASRLRTQVLQTHEFQPGESAGTFYQDQTVWWESGGVLWHSQPGERQGWLVQAGWMAGDRTGASLEKRSPAWNGWRLGGLGGAWESLSRRQWSWVALPYLDWDSPRRHWFGRLEGGRWWGQDLSARLRVGRRWGRVSMWSGIGATDRENLLLEGRLEWNLEGLAWRPVRGMAVRPEPNWGHTLRTRVAMPGEYNDVTMSEMVEPDVLVRLRD